MAYNKQEIYKQAEKAIKDNNLFFIEDIVAWLPCDKTTFYRLFKIDSNEYNDLRTLLEDNKIRTKSAIRAKLFKSPKAAELLALYRLICTPEEHKLLNQQYIDHSNKGDKFEAQKLTNEQIDKLIEKL